MFTKKDQKFIASEVEKHLRNSQYTLLSFKDCVIEYVKTTNYGFNVIKIIFSKNDISLPFYRLRITEVEECVNWIVGVENTKEDSNHTYVYYDFEDQNINQEIKNEHSRQLNRIIDNYRKTNDINAAISQYLHLIVEVLEKIALPFFEKCEINPFYISEVNKSHTLYYPGNALGYKSDPACSGWWIRRIFCAKQNGMEEAALQYYADFKRLIDEITESNHEPDMVQWATEIYHRTHSLFENRIENSKVRAPIPERLSYLLEHISNNDDVVDQFGTIDIFGMYFINGYREDFIKEFCDIHEIALEIKYQEIDNEQEIAIIDILKEEKVQYLYYVCNKEENYTLMTFATWNEKSMNLIFGNGLHPQQVALATLFPQSDIVGISFQETTGCAGFVHLKGKEKIRGFYHIMGETKTDFGHIPEDDTIEKEDYFGKQEKAFERLFPHTINSKILEQTVSILKKR